MIVDLHVGDSTAIMTTLDADSVDAVVTDPPYGLRLLQRTWDAIVPGVDAWAQALRVAKPGAHLAAFGGTRTMHRLMIAIEDAGWEIRDQIAWHYASGFPKGVDVSNAIDANIVHGGTNSVRLRMTNASRPGSARVRSSSRNNKIFGDERGPKATRDTPATDEARVWVGWNTALKPAMELIVLARKPLRGTVAENVQQYGTGALNIDACRHEARWPSNMLHDGSDEVIPGMRDASKYFYCAKASRADRDDGCAELPLRRSSSIEARNRESNLGQFDGPTPMGRNYHPTVKPTALMTYLCRLVTPPGGVVLDPFCGSGSTGRGALIAGASRFVGIDQDSEYIEIARRRIEASRLPLDAHWSAE